MWKGINMDDYVDWRFVRNIFAIREITMNLDTRRKQIYGVFYFVTLCVLLFVCIRLTDPVKTGLFAWIEYTLLALAVILYGTEPFVLILQTIVFQHPAVDLNNLDREDTSDIALVISCHKSADVIVRTCEAAMKHLRPEQIFVMDNANFLDPPDNTREVLAEADLHEVNYIYNPFGNKTLAMFAGSVAAKDYKYLCLIDDDVTIPEDMNFGKVLMSDRVKAICYPIRAVHPDQGNDDSYFIKWQGIEYKMADYAKMIQNQWSTVLYPHGACALWDRKVLIDCFRDHDTVFFADDVKMGLWFTRHGYEMRIHYQVMVDTDAPASMIGPMPNFYNQRVRSWDMAEHAYAYAHVRVFFTTTHPTILGTIVMKWYQFYALYSIMADQLRCPVMILTSLVNARYFVTITGYFLLCYTAIVVVWDWWGYQRCPERKSTIWALLSFQLYKVPSILIRQIGMARAYLIYLPNYKAKPTIPELEREYRRASRDTSAGMRKCPVWIDYSNPTFGHYYQHYDPSRPTENCKDVEGARPEYDYEPAPIVRPTALAAGSITSGGSSITSVTMDPIDVKAGEPSVEKDTPPSSQQLSSPYSGSSDSNSFSASSGGKSSLMGRSWLTGIPEGHEGSSGGVLTRKGSQSVYSLDSSSTIDSAIVSESSMKNKGAKSKKQSTVQRTVPQPGQPSDSETKTPRQQTSGDPTDASGAEEQPIQQ